ncbi:helix-turn-helix domain-containing protein [Muricauda sp. MAR_2010_75]|uniref:helix-turn-helix domain-containing protein n=1 Tax=Allomuricauda sp. MAR_2010_75 TaxID=1250232 RepID=UPI00055B26DD|nr:helix-turn-helix domain-containing protein [Muricauda sp. MAR_2010_75]
MTRNIKISRLTNRTVTSQEGDFYSVLWIKDAVQSITIDNTLYENIVSAVYFLKPNFKWKIIRKDTSISSGYVLYLPKNILEDPLFKNLHINEVRVFNTEQIPKVNLAPGIEIRIQAILEMLDELISTNLKHKESAILSLISTFFVYIDGKCNIKSSIDQNNAKSVLVYKFKKAINEHFSEFHEVGEYARKLNISDKYLHECVKEVLGTSAKHLIDEQLTMCARRELKFTDKTVKEIAYGMGFSSPEYFSYYFKKQTGKTPSQVRKE